jgi:CRP-like cAMP-binding protein/predicted MFS family arabinose efflux permease
MTALSSAATDRRLLRAILGFGISWGVFYAYWAATLLFALTRGGAELAGLVLAAMAVPSILFTSPLASLADRLPRGTVMWVNYATNGLLLAAMAVLIRADAPMLPIVVSACVATTCSSLSRPIFLATIPHLAATPQSLCRATAAVGFFEGAGTFLGSALAGFLALLVGYSYIFAAFALALMLSAVLSLRLKIPRPDAPGENSKQVRNPLAGFAAVAKDGGLITLTLVVALATSLSGVLQILATSFATSVLHAHEFTQGLLIGAPGIGGVIGSLLASVLILRPRLAPQILFGLGGAALAISAMALVSNLPVALVTMLLCGLGLAVTVLATYTLLNRIVPAEVSTRVFAVMESVFIGGWALGNLLGPTLLDRLGTQSAYAALGLVALALALLAYLRLREVDHRSDFRPEVVELLGSVPSLSALPALVLDRVAKSAHWWDVPTGTIVVRQGDYLDEMFIVREGSLMMTKDGAPAGTLSAGDWFEDAAIHRTSTRTATLTTLEPTRLLVVERASVLEAVANSQHGLNLEGLLSEDDLEARIFAALTRAPAPADELQRRTAIASDVLQSRLDAMTHASLIRENAGTYYPQLGIRHRMSSNVIDRAILDGD